MQVVSKLGVAVTASTVVRGVMTGFCSMLGYCAN